MRQSEFKRKYDPELGKYTKQHIWSGKSYIYGGGIIDTVKSFFKPTPKPTVIPKPPKKVRFVEQLSRSFEQPAANKKAGDEIVKLLSRESPAPAKPSRKKIVR